MRHRTLYLSAAVVATTLLALAASARAKDGIRSDRTENGSISVDLMFTKDGCSVYRFYDESHARYFVTCPGQRIVGQTDFTHTEQQGKTSVTVVGSIPTVVAP